MTCKALSLVPGREPVHQNWALGGKAASLQTDSFSLTADCHPLLEAQKWYYLITGPASRHLPPVTKIGALPSRTVFSH